MRPLPVIAASLAAVLAFPSVALAAESNPDAYLSVPPVSLIVSLIGLGVAIILLVEAMAVRKVAMGGVIAEKISYVILAVVCMATAAVAAWLVNFVDGVTLDQLRFVSDVLVTAAMGLLAVYFASIRKTFQGYLKSAQESVEPAPAAEEAE